jgi:eukaryotic-like serine/threonine-protein kinase
MLRPGSRLAHYEVLALIGEGGMGEVYRAEDTKLRRQIALKVLSQELAVETTRRERFTREAQTVAALNHPNIVTLYSVEEAGGTHFLTMELVEGATLAARLPRHGFTLAELLRIAVREDPGFWSGEAERRVARKRRDGNQHLARGADR